MLKSPHMNISMKSKLLKRFFFSSFGYIALPKLPQILQINYLASLQDYGHHLYLLKTMWAAVYLRRHKIVWKHQGGVSSCIFFLHVFSLTEHPLMAGAGLPVW